MNRRAFLSFLSVAPVAVPMVASAMAAQPASSWLLPLRFVPLSEGIAGEAPGLESRVTLRAFTPDEICALDAGGMSETQWHKCLSDLSVEDQMQDHDLFDLDSSVIGDNAQHTLVSPESEKQIPTAATVDLCHSAQDTETLSPKLDRRLCRSWGADEGMVA